MAMIVRLPESSGALFSLKEVSWTPIAPKMKEPFTIKGKIDLFNLRFLALVWVVVSVTYPKRLTDVLGPPIGQNMSTAWFGNFSITFPEGFDREGEYSLDINVYLGPTVTESLGFISSKSITIPPIPPVTSLPTQKFTVSGEMAPEQKQYTIGKPTVTPDKIYEGTKVTISVPVTSQAAQQESVTVRLKVDYGSALAGPGNTIKTISATPTTMAPGESKTFTFDYTEVAPNDGRRDTEVDVLVNDVSKGYDHQNDLWTVLTASAGFTLSQPTASPNPVSPGGVVTLTCPVTSKYTETKSVTAKVYIYEGSILPTHGTLLSTKTVNFSISPGQTYNVVVTDTAVAGSIDRRDVGVELFVGGSSITSDEWDDVFYVQSAGETPKGTILSIVLEHSGLYDTLPASNIPAGGTGKIHVHARNDMSTTQALRVLYDVYASNHTTVIYHFDSTDHYANPGQDTDFYPTLATFNIPSTGPVYVDASAQINGVTVATKSTQFAISGGGAATLSASYSNGVCSFSFSGFQPNASVTLTVKETGGYLTATANSSGSGSGSFADSDPSGTYTLQATDSYGHSATASFTITPPATAVTLTSLNIASQAAYGQTVTALLGFSYKGPATNLILEVSLGEKSAIGGAFTVESGMKWQQSKAVAESTSPTAMSGSVNITIPSGVPTKLYDVLSRVLDQNGNELASRIDSGMITIVSGGGGGGVGISFQVAVWGVPAFGTYQYWWAYYWDPGIGDFVNCGNWYSSSSKITFSNVQPGGYFAVFLMKDSTVSSQYTSPTFQAANGGSYTYDVQMGVIYG